MREAAIWSFVWVLVSLVFVGWLWFYLEGTAGPEIAKTKALEFVTGYTLKRLWRSTTSSSS
jgi:tellurite resistance protein TerC